MMALRGDNSKDWIVTSCKEHSYLYLGYSSLMTTQSHLPCNLLSPFHLSAWSDRITNVLVLPDNTDL